MPRAALRVPTVTGAVDDVRGAPIQGFIDRYFTGLAWAFVILLVGGFVLIERLH